MTFVSMRITKILNLEKQNPIEQFKYRSNSLTNSAFVSGAADAEIMPQPLTLNNASRARS